jgi:hypothetical protein
VDQLPDLIKRENFRISSSYLTPPRTLIRRAEGAADGASAQSQSSRMRRRLRPCGLAIISPSGEITARGVETTRFSSCCSGTAQYVGVRHTERPGSAPRARKAECWRTSLQRPEAFKFLDDVFRILEGG